MKSKDFKRSKVAKVDVQDIVDSSIHAQIGTFISARDTVMQTLVSVLESDDEAFSSNVVQGLVRSIFCELGVNPDLLAQNESLEDAFSELEDRIVEVKDILVVLVGQIIPDSMPQIFTMVDSVSEDLKHVLAEIFEEDESFEEEDDFDSAISDFVEGKVN